MRLNFKTALQVTVDNKNIDQLDEIADYCLRFPNLYGVVFLAYKPVGRGEVFRGPLATLDPLYVKKRFSGVLARLGAVMKVGYDCCLSPALFGLVDKHTIEGCSALRSSIGITAGLDVVPCTFVSSHVLGNLNESKLKEIFRMRGERERFIAAAASKLNKNLVCSSCDIKKECHGGCPVMSLTNCDANYLNYGG